MTVSFAALISCIVCQDLYCMTLTRTVIALSLAMIIGQGYVQAAPVLSLDNARSERAVTTTNGWVEVNQAVFETMFVCSRAV